MSIVPRSVPKYFRLESLYSDLKSNDFSAYIRLAMSRIPGLFRLNNFINPPPPPPLFATSEMSSLKDLLMQLSLKFCKHMTFFKCCLVLSFAPDAHMASATETLNGEKNMLSSEQMQPSCRWSAIANRVLHSTKSDLLDNHLWPVSAILTGGGCVPAEQ